MLRLLFFLLLALNLGLFAWHAWVAPERGEQTMRVTQPTDNRLELAESPASADPPASTDSEETSSEQVEVEAEDSGQPPQESAVDWRPSGCIAVGGTVDEEAVRDLAQQLGIRSPRIETDSVESIVGWWVILPPERVDDAQDMAGALEAAGESDYFVIGTGEVSGGISLGLYSAPERARNRLREVRSLGFDPVIRERREEVARYWLNLPLGFDLSPLGEARSDIGLRPAMCPDEPDSLVTRPQES